jgi:hypothetical protein
VGLHYAHEAEIDKEWKSSLKKIGRLRAAQTSFLERKPGSTKNLH